MVTCSLAFDAEQGEDGAARLAASLTGHRVTRTDNGERYEVPLTAESLPQLQMLTRLVSSRPGTQVLMDGDEVGAEKLASFRQLLACRRDREMNTWDTERCWGLKGKFRGRVPCRLINRSLPADPAEYPAASDVPCRLAACEDATLVRACPNYDHDAVLSAARRYFAQATDLA